VDFSDYLKHRKELIEAALQRFVPGGEGKAATLFKARRYSLFAGGKRLRPILMLAAAESVGGNIEAMLPVACSVEMIHTYSLIHDDLPAMDNDDFRRGSPTSHKVFGEATAILAGDALLTDAFALMTSPEVLRAFPHGKLLEAIHEIACAAGSQGMVGGQLVDIESQGGLVDSEALDFIHQNKTGALIRASVRVGAILAGGSPAQVDDISHYGLCAGLAFQIVDDILDVEGDHAQLGKAVRSDARKKKATYPALFGLEESRRRARELADEAINSLARFGPEADPLRMLARYIVQRDH
jgi:geranylgeranyl diphosphate synthase type II